MKKISLCVNVDRSSPNSSHKAAEIQQSGYQNFSGLLVAFKILWLPKIVSKEDDQ